MLGAEQRTASALLAATTVWALVLGLCGATAGLLFLAPALLLAVPLCFGRYVGEETLARVRGARRPRAPRRVALAPRFARPVDAPPRGGLLIAWALATRPPPQPLHLT